MITVETGFSILSTRYKEDIVMLTNNNVPFLSIELKVAIPALFQMNEINDVVETLLYAKYLLKLQNLKTIVCCLTNTMSWHVFYYNGEEITRLLNLTFGPNSTMEAKFVKLYPLVYQSLQNNI